MTTFLLLTSLLLQDPAPARPSFPQRNVYEQLGACNADLWDLRTYARSLGEALDAKDKEIAELKAKLDKQTEPKEEKK